ncbi:hypothetical protein AJ80_07784 [Polytolypa hystricis UAMH7299]|uniref:Carboxylic ester hydrolase n=1 Tax=Polytolypa hystricis (strain UAMH7299) TaxID=1447883 RepID=A0A2B7XHY7_POLH7|nr:hypothetical protein AJ80_07784 [Polytolypa hystricis UAMH7299]
MSSTLKSVLCTAFLSVLSVNAASVKHIGSDITILTHNDLYGNSSTRGDAAIVLNTPKTHSQAQKACEELGETLWTPKSSRKNSKAENVEFLQYLGYEDRDARRNLYWIGGGSRDRCQALKLDGSIVETRCNEKREALCTQSAPLAYDFKPRDTSKRWQTTVDTGRQSITGFRDKHTFVFEGIRYAEQPKRFTYSKLYNGRGNVDALAYGPGCSQALCDSPDCSEDCLFLNVWTPYLPKKVDRKTKLRPVMFFIHGGAFTGGTGAENGGDMVSRGDVVVVSINYRLGTVGFLALDDGKTNGNFGIADQIVALDWVREHIKDFGGDPDRITIFGQSAGAASVRAFLGSPQAIGKYSAAISQSNLGDVWSNYFTIEEEVEVVGNAILEATGCASARSKVDCLRKVDLSELVNMPAVASFIVVDGKYVVKDKLPLDGSGKVARVPMMMGSLRDDAVAPIPMATTTDPVQALNDLGLPGPAIIGSGLFPTPEGPDEILNVFNVTARVATNGVFRCIDQATAYAAIENRLLPKVYLFEFMRSYQPVDWAPHDGLCSPPPTETHPYGDPSQEYYKCHAGELYYVWGLLIRAGHPPRDDYDVPFSQYIVDAWTSFARTHDPNPRPDFLAARGFSNTTAHLERSGLWTPATSNSLNLRELDWPSRQVDFKEQEQCEALGVGLDHLLGGDCPS